MASLSCAVSPLPQPIDSPEGTGRHARYEPWPIPTLKRVLTRANIVDGNTVKFTSKTLVFALFYIVLARGMLFHTKSWAKICF